MLLLSPCLMDWLPKEHLAFFISDTVDQLDINDIQNQYEKELKGLSAIPSTNDAEDLFYGHCVGVRSCRKIARKVEEDIAFWFLAGDSRPKFRSIREFRQRRLTWPCA